MLAKTTLATNTLSCPRTLQTHKITLRPKLSRPTLARAASSSVAPPPSPTPTPTPSPSSPWEADATKGFKMDWSVNFWHPFSPSTFLPQEGQSLQESANTIASTAQTALNASGVLTDAQASSYWTYHLARIGFFTVQGIASLLAYDAANLARGRGAEASSTRVEDPVATNSRTGTLLQSRASFSYVGEALATFYQDFKNIQAGKYNLPWDMVTTGHRQFNPLFILGKGRLMLREAVSTLSRRFTPGSETHVWIDSALYPDYYLNTFHYQTDGWLSPASAKIYETSTETLFVGRQDAMQRQTLVPIAEFMQQRAAGDVSILEVACGTGRFATFVKDNSPQARYTALDLSPFYLEEARNNMSYWKQMRAPELALGGFQGTGVRFLQAAAENIPEPDNTYDIVFSVYLFHELPPEVRRKVAGQMARCCKPGGLVVLTDSVQTGDRLSFDATLDRFGDFNEPYYRSYIEDDLGEVFIEAGLVPDMKVMASSTKVLSFRKPSDNNTPTSNTTTNTTPVVEQAPVGTVMTMDVATAVEDAVEGAVEDAVDGALGAVEDAVDGALGAVDGALGAVDGAVEDARAALKNEGNDNEGNDNATVKGNSV